jgi:RNA polymerase sigma-70 factor (ECF subfamily)
MDYERFSSLVLPHTAIMAHVAAALVGPSNAEDAAQEALMRAWRGWQGLRDPESVRSWLLRITANVCHTWQARSLGVERRMTQSLDAREEDAARLQITTDDVGTSAHADSLDLRSAVATLSDEFRTVVLLRYFAGLDATEIGAMLDVPPATVRTRLRRALLAMRDILGVEEDDTPAPVTQRMERGN